MCLSGLLSNPDDSGKTGLEIKNPQTINPHHTLQSVVIRGTAKCRLFIELELIELAGVFIKHALTQQLNKSWLHMNSNTSHHQYGCLEAVHILYNTLGVGEGRG